jgi:hypothetical protein
MLEIEKGVAPRPFPSQGDVEMQGTEQPKNGGFAPVPAEKVVHLLVGGLPLVHDVTSAGSVIEVEVV